jgi:hypothetical protein
MTIAIGLGNSGLRTTDIAGGPLNQKLLDYPVFSFELSQEVTQQEALAYVAGRHQIEEQFESAVATTLKLSTEIANWTMIGFSIGQLQRTLTSFAFPVAKRANVPASGTPEITDTDITAASSAKTVVAITRKGPWGEAGPLTVVTTAPTAGQVQVAGATGKLVFHSSAAGAPISYVIDKTEASVEGYGGPGTLAKIGEMEFFGEVYTNSAAGRDGGTIWIPRIQRSTRPTFSFSGDKVTLENEFKCLSVPGWEEPFAWIRKVAS